jgi:hypothetical protein
MCKIGEFVFVSIGSSSLLDLESREQLETGSTTYVKEVKTFNEKWKKFREKNGCLFVCDHAVKEVVTQGKEF